MFHSTDINLVEWEISTCWNVPKWEISTCWNMPELKISTGWNIPNCWHIYKYRNVHRLLEEPHLPENMSRDMDQNEGLENFATVGRIVHRLQVSEIFARLIGRGRGVGAGTSFTIASDACDCVLIVVGRAAPPRITHFVISFFFSTT